MRLVAWNCRLGFIASSSVAGFAPDVAIVPEFGSLEILQSKAPGLTLSSALWIGDNPHKGLGVFFLRSARPATR
jgi:hypothetical protein